MKLAILGTGGVGGYFGGRLAQAGNDVTFLARGEHLRAIRQNGLTVKSIKGDITISPAVATDIIKDIGPVDCVIVAVKAWQVKDIAKDLHHIVTKDTMVLPLENGVLAADELAEHISHDSIVGGLCRIISKIESPGVISHFGMEPTILFGEFNNTSSVRLQTLQTLFNNAGIHAHISRDITADLWKKLISICLSGLLAVTRTTYGELRELKETRQMMYDVLHEVYALSQKIGVHIEADYIDKAVALIDSFPYDSTSSLTRDVWEGKPSEIEYQNGTVIRLAEKYGIKTPVNRFIYTCILPMEMKARKLLVKK